MKKGLSKFHLMILFGVVLVISVIFILGIGAQVDSLPPLPPPKADILYRCLVEKADDHFDTTTPTECTGSPSNGIIEGPLGYIYETSQLNTQELYRCYTISGDHFDSVDSNCEVDSIQDPNKKIGEAQFRNSHRILLGFISKIKEDHTQPLYRCYNGKDHWSTLDIGCEKQTTSENNLLGYTLINPPVPVQNTQTSTPITCQLKVLNTDSDCETVDGVAGGSGSDVSLFCNSPNYVAVGINIVDYNNPTNMRADKYKVKCCKLTCS